MSKEAAFGPKKFCEGLGNWFNAAHLLDCFNRKPNTKLKSIKIPLFGALFLSYQCLHFFPYQVFFQYFDNGHTFPLKSTNLKNSTAYLNITHAIHKNCLRVIYLLPYALNLTQSNPSSPPSYASSSPMKEFSKMEANLSCMDELGRNIKLPPSPPSPTSSMLSWMRQFSYWGKNYPQHTLHLQMYRCVKDDPGMSNPGLNMAGLNVSLNPTQTPLLLQGYMPFHKTYLECSLTFLIPRWL